jgi:hypothetical protein
MSDMAMELYEECWHACLMAVVLYGDDAAAHLDMRAIAERLAERWLDEDEGGGMPPP